MEEKILKSFTKKMGKEVEGLDLMVVISPDCWPEDLDNIYTCEVMEKQDNGRVWTCECTKNGNIKEIYEI